MATYLHTALLWSAGLAAPIAAMIGAVALGLGYARRAEDARLRRRATGDRGPARNRPALSWDTLVCFLRAPAMLAAGSSGRELERELVRSGQTLGVSAQRLHGHLVGLGLAGAGLGAALGVGAHAPLAVITLAGCGAVGGARLAAVRCRGEVAAAREGLVWELPALIDMMALCARAGMPLDQSIDLYCARFTGRLAAIFAAARATWAIGAQTRSGEMQRLAAEIDSPVFDRFLGALRHATEMGTPLAPVLEAQADDVRTHRQSAIEEQAAKLPVKMRVPIGLFTLPAMLIMLLTPVLAQVGAGLAPGGG